jgi:hypothetical protein
MTCGGNIGPYGKNVSKCFFSETTWTVETKLPRIDHWKILCFLCRSEIPMGYLIPRLVISLSKKTEALKSLYRSPGNKKKQLVLCKKYVLQW